MSEIQTPQQIVSEILGAETDDGAQDFDFKEKAQEVINRIESDRNQNIVDNCIAIYNLINDPSSGILEEKKEETIKKLDEFHIKEQGIPFCQMLARVYPKHLPLTEPSKSPEPQKMFLNRAFDDCRIDGDLVVGINREGILIYDIKTGFNKEIDKNDVKSQIFTDTLISIRFSASGDIIIGGRFNFYKYDREGNFLDHLNFNGGASKCFEQFHDGRIVSGIGQRRLMITGFGMTPEFTRVHQSVGEVNDIETLPTGDFYALFEKGALYYFYREKNDDAYDQPESDRQWQYEKVTTDPALKRIHAISSNEIKAVSEDDLRAYIRSESGEWASHRDRLSSRTIGEFIFHKGRAHLGHYTQVDFYDKLLPGDYVFQGKYDGGYNFQIAHDGRVLTHREKDLGMLLYE